MNIDGARKRNNGEMVAASLCIQPMLRPAVESTQFLPPKAALSPHRMESASEITILKAVPAQAGNGWRVFIQWASGRIQYISGFESLQDAEHWIAAKAQNWLNALNTQL